MYFEVKTPERLNIKDIYFICKIKKNIYFCKIEYRTTIWKRRTICKAIAGPIHVSEN